VRSPAQTTAVVSGPHLDDECVARISVSFLRVDRGSTVATPGHADVDTSPSPGASPTPWNDESPLTDDSGGERGFEPGVGSGQTRPMVSFLIPVMRMSADALANSASPSVTVANTLTGVQPSGPNVRTPGA
jgi:hypothetical protein